MKTKLAQAKDASDNAESFKKESEEKLKEMQAKLESSAEEHESQAAAFEVEKEKMNAGFASDLATAEKKLKGELEKIRRDMQRKSAAAQDIYKSQTEKISQLTKDKEELQEEINSGSASDRRLFEIAQKQSSREATVTAEIEIREAAVLRMMKTLVGKDGEYADMEMKYISVREQLEEYSRRARRDDLNVDYLKGVLVQYLSLPAGSSERKSLLSVLATLLQFGPDDYSAIEQGYNQVSWWNWGAVTPKEIGVKKATVAGVGATATAARAAAMTKAAQGGEALAAPISSPSTPATGSLMKSSTSESDDRVGEVKVSGGGGAGAGQKTNADKKKDTRKKRTSMQF